MSRVKAPMRAFRRTIGLLAVVCALVIVGAAGASSPADYAKGVGVTTDGTAFHFTVHSETAGRGEASGKIRIETANGTTSATATCMAVETFGSVRTALIIADVLSTTDPLAAGDVVFLRVTDGGPKGAGDGLVFNFLGINNASVEHCFPLFLPAPANLAEGEIVIFDQ